VTNPKNATTGRDGKRLYSWRGENYWSVTTLISGGLPKPALLPWGIKSTAEGVVKQRGVLAEMLKTCETPGECAQGNFCGPCDQTIRWAKSLPYSMRDRAADLGTQIHEWIEAHRLGKPMPTVPPAVKPYLAAFERFLADFAPDYHMVEAGVYNRSQHYAGTLDAIVRLQLPLSETAGQYLLDAKSGKGVYPEVALQLAAYRFAEFVGVADGSEQEMPSTDGGLVLHLTPTGYRLIEVRCDEDIFQSFLYCREVFRFVSETGKTVFGQEFGSAVEPKQEALIS
jgi:hypothetical protein